MARVTANEVKAILDDTELTDAVVEGFINSANTLVTNVLGSSTLGESVLAEIEKWLAAHMIASTRERMAEQEEAGEAKIKYIGQYGSGLSSTPYGQMVLTLDLTGKMAALGRKQAKLYAVPFEEW